MAGYVALLIYMMVKLALESLGLIESGPSREEMRSQGVYSPEDFKEGGLLYEPDEPSVNEEGPPGEEISDYELDAGDEELIAELERKYGEDR